MRVRIAAVAQSFALAAAVVITTAPVVLAVIHSPTLQVGIGVALLGVRVAFHLLTLPVEFNAGFRRALPILETGRFLDADDIPGARTVLRAAALASVASSLVALVNIARFRRRLPFRSLHGARPNCSSAQPQTGRLLSPAVGMPSRSARRKFDPPSA